MSTPLVVASPPSRLLIGESPFAVALCKRAMQYSSLTRRTT